jgi:hypothetical protein
MYDGLVFSPLKAGRLKFVQKKEAAQQSISSQMAVARAPAHAVAAVERERHDHTRRGKSDNHATTHYPRRRPPRPPGTETPARTATRPRPASRSPPTPHHQPTRFSTRIASNLGHGWCPTAGHQKSFKTHRSHSDSARQKRVERHVQIWRDRAPDLHGSSTRN